MLPSGRLFLDPNAVYQNRRALHRAKWLVDSLSADLQSDPELGHFAMASCRGRRFLRPTLPTGSKGRLKTRPFPGIRRRGRESAEELNRSSDLVARVADSHPRLLAWLAEGRVSCYWNVFGFWIAFLRLVPGLRWIVWRLLFEPVARRAPWRLELYEAILQRERYKRNNRPYANRFSPTLTIGKTPGLSAVTEMAAITPTASREDMRRKIEKMSSGCIGVSGLRGSGKSSLIHDFCRHRYGTPKRSRPAALIARTQVHGPGATEV